jgi:hypothetical protein
MAGRRHASADPGCRMRRRLVHAASGSPIPRPLRDWCRPVRSSIVTQYGLEGCATDQFHSGAGRSDRLLAPDACRRHTLGAALPPVSESMAKNRPVGATLAWTCCFPNLGCSRRFARMPQQLAHLHRGMRCRADAINRNSGGCRTVCDYHADHALRTKIHCFWTQFVALQDDPRRRGRKAVLNFHMEIYSNSLQISTSNLDAGLCLKSGYSPLFPCISRKKSLFDKAQAPFRLL